jgi:AcrR family transcriptional regulator
VLTATVAGVPLSDLVEVNSGSPGPRSKLAAILDAAVARFGQDGYEATKWSTVADEVGIGQTALYHYFESKAHCLLTIMRLELALSHQRFLLSVPDSAPTEETIRAALRAAFDVTGTEIRRLRILAAHNDLLATPRSSKREESERLLCRELTRAIEESWTELLRCRPDAESDPADARMLARAVLGLVTSVWRWYRADGPTALSDVSDFYVRSALRIVS